MTVASAKLLSALRVQSATGELRSLGSDLPQTAPLPCPQFLNLVSLAGGTLARLPHAQGTIRHGRVGRWRVHAARKQTQMVAKRGEVVQGLDMGRGRFGKMVGIVVPNRLRAHGQWGMLD